MLFKGAYPHRYTNEFESIIVLTSLFVYFFNLSIFFLIIFTLLSKQEIYVWYSLVFTHDLLTLCMLKTFWLKDHRENHCNLSITFWISDPIGTMAQLRSSVEKPNIVPMHNTGWNSQSTLYMQHLGNGEKHINSQIKWKKTRVSCVNTAEDTKTTKSDGELFWYWNKVCIVLHRCSLWLLIEWV